MKCVLFAYVIRPRGSKIPSESIFSICILWFTWFWRSFAIKRRRNRVGSHRRRPRDSGSYGLAGFSPSFFCWRPANMHASLCIRMYKHSYTSAACWAKNQKVCPWFVVDTTGFFEKWIKRHFGSSHITIFQALTYNWRSIFVLFVTTEFLSDRVKMPALFSPPVFPTASR